MISAAAAENHTFARVKRNGYDPHEVDAVVSRLVADLQRAQARIDELTRDRPQSGRVDASDEMAAEPPEIRHLVDALR